ncbi:MAG: hypothetical protein SFX72_20095 [Isosphaeraceae bacterium]|nr:hypothetical protein [Isosphaeraceae bacterium]
MSTCKSNDALEDLDLPREFEDLEAFIRSDLKAIVKAVANRGNERLLLSRREYRALQVALWNRLTLAINETLEPLTAENR